MKRTRFVADFRAQGDAGARVRDMVVYSETPVYRFDWWTGKEFMLTLSMDKSAVDLNRLANAPLLADHYRSVDSQVGVLEKAWIDNRKLMATARFADTPGTSETWAKVEQGIIRNVSVEASINQTKDITKKGDQIQSLLAIDWTPEAVALVPVGADPNATLLSSEDSQEIWLPGDLYRKPEHFAAAGAASVQNRQQNSLLLSLLLRRRAA